MTTEAKERAPIKTCPWWARVATAPNGWVIAYCSLDACERDEKNGRVWEGPPKGEQCAFGYNKGLARVSPAIIFYQPQTGLNGEECVSNRWMSDKVWSHVVEWFRREVAARESFSALDLGRIKNKTREVINQAWNT